MSAKTVHMSWKAAIIQPVIWADNAILDVMAVKTWVAIEI